MVKATEVDETSRTRYMVRLSSRLLESVNISQTEKKTLKKKKIKAQKEN